MIKINITISSVVLVCVISQFTDMLSHIINEIHSGTQRTPQVCTNYIYHKLNNFYEAL